MLRMHPKKSIAFGHSALAGMVIGVTKFRNPHEDRVLTAPYWPHYLGLFHGVSKSASKAFFGC